MHSGLKIHVNQLCIKRRRGGLGLPKILAGKQMHMTCQVSTTLDGVGRDGGESTGQLVHQYIPQLIKEENNKTKQKLKHKQ